MTTIAELDARVGLAAERSYREEAAELDAAVAAWDRHRAAAGRDRECFQGSVDVDALVHARFIVSSHLDPALRQGLFAVAGDHPAIVRFSTFRRAAGAAAPVVDRGAAIKILVHRGGRALTLQDFILDFTTPTSVRAIADAVPDALPRSPVAGDADHPAGLTYYGALPSRLGRHRAIKFALRPRAAEPAGAATLAGALASPRQLVYDFVVQLQLDPERQPIEDASVPWDTPWIALAEVRLDRVEVAGVDPRGLVFHPFHALPEHDPLGRLNRLRRRLYGPPVVDASSSAGAYPFAPPRARVCVVGAGAAGMAAADALARRGHAVVLVDAHTEVGGHAESIRCGDLETDPSFGSFTAATHPNLVALLARLGVDAFELAAFNEAGSWRTADGAHEWGSTEAIPFHREILAEVLRFNRVDLPRVLRDPAFDDVSAADFLAAGGYSRAFVVYYFFGHAVYGFPGHPYAHYLDLPIRALLTYLFDSTVHGAQALFSVAGGSGRYARAFGELLRATGRVDLRLGARASVIERGEGGVVVDIAGRAERFDHLVLAVQPQHALRVLGDAATAAEREVLGGFRYTRDTVYLHTDASQMPRRRDLWRYLNIVVPPPAELAAATHFVATKVMPANRGAAAPVFMTFAHHDGFVPPAGAAAITRDHPRIDLTTPRQRRRLDALAGDRSTWYCGAYTRGLALHDDALVSGYAVANRILGAAEAVDVIQRPALLERERPEEPRSAVAAVDPAALDPAALAAALRRALDQADGRERGGPVERLAREAARRLAAGPAAPSARDEASLAEAIARIVASIAGVAVPVDAPLSAAVALDSLGLVELAEALRVALQLDLPPSLLVRDVTIAALARHAAAEARRVAPTLAPGLERLGAPAGAPPLFLLPPLFLDVGVFAELARELARDRPVYGLRAPTDADDVERLVDAHVRAIVDAVPGRCCYLGGYSLGGALAHRIAERLVLEHGFTCPLVFMFDAHHPAALGDAEFAADALDRSTLVRLFLHSVGAPRDDWEAASDDDRRALALAAYRRLRDRGADAAAFDAFLRARHALLRGLEGALLRADDEAPLELPELIYFRAATRDPSGRHAERWSGHYVFATTHDLPGDHGTLLRAREAIVPVMREAMATAASVAVDLDGDPAAPASLFDLEARLATGERRGLAEHRGKVLLVVNVASRCVFTPHYEGLEALHRAYGERGFAVLGFPSNEFGGQEPGDDPEIAAFCATHYGVTFPVYAKVETRGPRACPVYRFLGERAGAPAWNFAKYLVDRAGQVVEVFPSAVSPDDPALVRAIEAALAR